MIFFVILLIILISVLVYLIRIQIKKIQIYEEFILERRNAYKELLQRIREIDSKEIFEKDDDVGVTFSEIKDEIEEFDKFIE